MSLDCRYGRYRIALSVSCDTVKRETAAHAVRGSWRSAGQRQRPAHKSLSTSQHSQEVEIEEAERKTPGKPPPLTASYALRLR